jgi:hypothetical protein
MTALSKIQKNDSIKNESLENIKEENDQQNINNFLETLNSVRKYQNEYLELGIERVNKYVDSVEGDWLENW